MLVRRARVLCIDMLLMLLAVFPVACGDMIPPEVLDVIPAHHAVVDPGMAVTVIFSEQMNRKRTQRSFTLVADDAIRGRYRWERGGRRMIFIPERSLPNGSCTIRISREAEDRAGNCLSREFISRFSVGTDLIPPVVVTVSPENLTRNFPLDGSMMISFSEPMNRMSVERGVWLSPQVDGQFRWHDDSSVTFTPHSNLSFRTDYAIIISNQCRDYAGNTLPSLRELYFTAGDEFQRPVIERVVDISTGADWASQGTFCEYHGVERNTALVFWFSEPVNRASFSRSLRIYPHMDTTFSWNESSTRCEVRFVECLESCRQYELRVDRELADCAGNEMAEDFVVFFTVDGAFSEKPAIAMVEAFDASGISVPLVPDEIVDMGDEYSDERDCDIRVLFTKDVLRSTLPDNVEIRYIYGEQPELSGAIKRFRWNDAAYPDRMVRITLSSIEGGNLYQLLLRGGNGGITGVNGVPLDDDVCFFLMFTAKDR